MGDFLLPKIRKIQEDLEKSSEDSDAGAKQSDSSNNEGSSCSDEKSTEHAPNDGSDEQDYGSAEDGECSICLLDLDNVSDCRVTSCGHHFHKDCIESWVTLQKKEDCPLCRAKVTLDTLEECKNCHEEILPESVQALVPNSTNPAEDDGSDSDTSQNGSSDSDVEDQTKITAPETDEADVILPPVIELPTQEASVVIAEPSVVSTTEVDAPASTDDIPAEGNIVEITEPEKTQAPEKSSKEVYKAQAPTPSVVAPKINVPASPTASKVAKSKSLSGSQQAKALRSKNSQGKHVVKKAEPTHSVESSPVDPVRESASESASVETEVSFRDCSPSSPQKCRETSSCSSKKLWSMFSFATICLLGCLLKWYIARQAMLRRNNQYCCFR